jgi:hypothetical protein
MTYEHVHAFGWSSSGASSLSSRSLRRVEGEDSDMTRDRQERNARGRVGTPEAGLGLGRGRRHDERRRGPGRGVAPRCRRRECRDASRGRVRHEGDRLRFLCTVFPVFSRVGHRCFEITDCVARGKARAGNRRRVFSRDLLFRQPGSGIHRKPRIEVSGVQSLPRLAPGGVRPAP